MDALSSHLRHQSPQLHAFLCSSTTTNTLSVLRSVPQPWLILFPIFALIFYAVAPYKAMIVFCNLFFLFKLVLVSILVMIVLEVNGYTKDRKQAQQKPRPVPLETLARRRPRVSTMSSTSAIPTYGTHSQRNSISSIGSEYATRPDLQRRGRSDSAVSVGYQVPGSLSKDTPVQRQDRSSSRASASRGAWTRQRSGSSASSVLSTSGRKRSGSSASNSSGIFDILAGGSSRRGRTRSREGT